MERPEIEDFGPVTQAVQDWINKALSFMEELIREKAELEKIRKCSNGEWPCEMNTHIASIEAENNRLETQVAELEERLRKATALVEIKTAAGKDLFDLLEECEIKLRKAEEALKGLKEDP